MVMSSGPQDCSIAFAVCRETPIQTGRRFIRARDSVVFQRRFPCSSKGFKSRNCRLTGRNDQWSSIPWHCLSHGRNKTWAVYRGESRPTKEHMQCPAGKFRLAESARTSFIPCGWLRESRERQATRRHWQGVPEQRTSRRVDSGIAEIGD